MRGGRESEDIKAREGDQRREESGGVRGLRGGEWRGWDTQKVKWCITHVLGLLSSQISVNEWGVPCPSEQ